MKQCNVCSSHKDASCFRLNRRTKKPVDRCKDCDIAVRRESQARWQARNPGVARQRTREWYAANRECVRQRERDKDQEVKDAAFAAYGGYVCACCGETEARFMTLDHIHNDGAAHRRSLFGRQTAGKAIYRWAIKAGYPPIFQVLCMNCNWGKAMNGGVCPHKTSEGSTTIP